MWIRTQDKCKIINSTKVSELWVTDGKSSTIYAHIDNGGTVVLACYESHLKAKQVLRDLYVEISEGNSYDLPIK